VCLGGKDRGHAIRRFHAKRQEQHPYARPVFPGAHGLWLVQQQAAPPFGYVTAFSSAGRWVFDDYAQCRDDGGR